MAAVACAHMAESVMARWYYALHGEDCIQLKRLLKAHPPLVLGGWIRDPMRTEKGDLQQPGAANATGQWTGCTVLHSAANRGCLELVNAVVDMFSTEHDGEWLLGDPQSTAADPTSGQALEGDALSLGCLLATKHGSWKLEPLAVAAVNGYREIAAALMAASRKCKSNPYEVESRRNQPSQALIDEQESDNVAALRRITEEVMASLTDGEKCTIETKYSADTTLTNLPLQEFGEYLFHFSVSNGSLGSDLSDKVQAGILERVSAGFESMEVERLCTFLKEKGPATPQTCVSSVPVASTRTNESDVPTSSAVTGDVRLRQLLRSVTRQVMASSIVSIEERKVIRVAYSQNMDFNFLAMDEYFFHFSFTNILDYGERYTASKVRGELWRKMDGDLELKRFVMFELRDGCGRSPLHIATENGSHEVRDFLSLVPPGEMYEACVNPLDNVGRTPLYMAAANGKGEALRALTEDRRVDLNAKSSLVSYAETLGLARYLSKRNGFQSSKSSQFLSAGVQNVTALQVSILLKKEKCVKLLLDDDNMNRRQGHQLDLTCKYNYETAEGEILLEPLALAVVVGDMAVVQLLLKNPRVRDHGRPSKWWAQQKLQKSTAAIVPAFHLAAALGKFDLLKLFLDREGIDKLYDPFVKDHLGNTAMHYVTLETSNSIYCDLLHCARVDQAPQLRLGKDHDKHDPKEDTKKIIERQGCVDLLIQAGLDVWTPNNKDQVPYPQLQTSPEFLSWWYKKLARETLEEQNTLNAAANAISVTAALVATASFVGPLQPPLSYETNAQGLPSQIQVRNLWVRMFITCDILSFYLAVGAIMLALIPSVPIPQQEVRMEIKHTRRIVAFAIGFLFPSVIFVLLAVAASTMAVIPGNHGGLKISTTIVGGSLCVLVICIFSIRVLALVIGKNTRIEKLYGESLFFDERLLIKLKGLWWTNGHTIQ